MPAKPSQHAEVNSFVRGLITEASPLNFPADASADEVNFELNRDGTRDRRLGMDFETDAAFIDSGLNVADLESAGISSFKWIDVSGKPEIEFLVVQFNQKIFFFDLTATTLSTLGFKGSVTITSFPVNTRFSFTSIEGFLVVAAGVDVIAKIVYNDSASSFTLSYNRLLVRDVWGIAEPDRNYDTDPSYRGSMSSIHRYNLQNQSWGITRKSAENIMVDPAQHYYEWYGSLAPSNSEQVWPGLQFQPVGAGQDPFERIYPDLYREVLGASPVSARGYFIIDALRRGSSRQEKVYANNAKYPQLIYYDPSFPQDYTPGGASVIAEFAGRVFYTGFKGEVINGDEKSPNYSNYVFFSQLVKNGDDIGKCYQEGDPTSRDSADIVDTDGGFLRISEAKTIIALVNLGSNLCAIATNGVWLISGGSDYGFSASNYKQAKISTFGGLSSSTVVSEGDRAYYWAADGIYVVSKNQFGDYEVSSITLATIQTLYEEIPTEAKAGAFGGYDNATKKVKWLFAEDGLSADVGNTKELIFDVALGAFYIHSINKLAAPYTNVLSLFQSSPYSSSVVDEEVFAGPEEVIAGSEDVVMRSRLTFSGILSTKYVSVKEVVGKIHFSFSLYRNSKFLDWESVDGQGKDARGFCLTGSQTAGDSSTAKQIPYLIMHFRKTETGLDQNLEPSPKSGCLVRAQWNFANAIQSNKWSPLMQAYRHRTAYLITGDDGSLDDGFTVVSSKTKLRGRGKAFALYFETEPLKDCKILGWNLTVNGNAIT